MPFFLTLKQIVDVLYEYKILSIIMIFIACGMIFYYFIKNKVYVNLFHRIDITDYIIILLGIIYYLSFLRNQNADKPIIKIESAFLIYFLGRFLGNENLKYKKICVAVAYVVLYVNVAYRIFEFIHYYTTRASLKNEQFGLWNGGALYHYKTDFALAIITCIVFIYAFSELKTLKWITIFPVSGIAVFTCNARACQAILIVEYLIILLMERKGKSTRVNVQIKRINIIYITITVMLSLLFIFILFTPIFKYTFDELKFPISVQNNLERIFHSRHIIWWDSLNYYRSQNTLSHLFGIDLCSEVLHNSRGDRFHNLYIKQIYSIGIVGCYLFYYMIYRIIKYSILENDNKLKYMFIGFDVLFLGISVSMESLEYTQMTWYVFILAGMMVTRNKMRDT